MATPRTVRANTVALRAPRLVAAPTPQVTAPRARVASPPSTSLGPGRSRCGPVLGLHWLPSPRLHSRPCWLSRAVNSRRSLRLWPTWALLLSPALAHHSNGAPSPPRLLLLAGPGHRATLPLPPSASPSWVHQSLASTFSTMTLNQPTGNNWYFDLGATSHMTPNANILSHTSFPRYPFPSSIVVGNSSLLSVTSTSAAQLPAYLRLNNILVSPNLTKNLISVSQFTSDHNCSVEFDPAGCSMKDLQTMNVIV